MSGTGFSTGRRTRPSFQPSLAVATYDYETRLCCSLKVASDDDAIVSYFPSGADASSFEIGSSTGQITTKSGVTYDYETKA